jgi:hypothetical protein
MWFMHTFLHIEWNADALVFCFVKSKGDQTGRSSNQEWRVYANPHNPKICPVLDLACYIFSNPEIFSAAAEDKVVERGGAGTQKECLFSGGNQYNRFMDCLHRILAKYSEEFFALGISPGNLGLHLARKGASSHACSGSTVLPPMVSIYLHAMLGGPVVPLPPIFFLLKILLSRTPFIYSGGVMVRQHFPNLALPIFDFAPLLNAIAIITNLPVLAGGYSPPCPIDRQIIAMLEITNSLGDVLTTPDFLLVPPPL